MMYSIKKERKEGRKEGRKKGRKKERIKTEINKYRNKSYKNSMPGFTHRHNYGNRKQLIDFPT